jgi:hypothetical protein
MIQSQLMPLVEGIVESMIALARCSKQQRIIVAGSNSAQLMFELHRQGYMRVVTTRHSGLPRGQCEVALVDWRGHSIKALETTLDWLVHFLTPTGVLVICVDPQDRAGNRKLRSVLEHHDLLVEAGTIREHGSAISARRRELNPISRVA